MCFTRILQGSPWIGAFSASGLRRCPVGTPVSSSRVALEVTAVSIAASARRGKPVTGWTARSSVQSVPLPK
jgi:hypothetical protein